MNPDNPYAAPQTVDTRQVLSPGPSAPRVLENRHYRWLKRGLASLAIILGPLTLFVVAVFQEYAVLGLSVILPFCCGMLAAVPPRTPGKFFLALAALAQVVGCFCLFVLVLLPKHDSDVYYKRLETLTMITVVAEIVFHLSLSFALLRIGHWLRDRLLCILNYCSLALSGLLFILLLMLYCMLPWWRPFFSPQDLSLLAGLAYLLLWLAMLVGLRIPRLVYERIPNPPRFEKRMLEQPSSRVPR